MFVDQKMFIPEIARKFGVSRGTVAVRLRKFGIKLPTRSGRQLGERCGAYKGGIKVSRGYRFIAVPPDSQHKRDQGGYVAEHRLVASEMIGRVVGEGEEVHHLNFNKMDNRPENLVIFGSGSDHTKFHKYLERIGAYHGGLTNEFPEPVVLSSQAFFRGEWVKVIDLKK